MDTRYLFAHKHAFACTVVVLVSCQTLHPSMCISCHVIHNHAQIGKRSQTLSIIGTQHDTAELRKVTLQTTDMQAIHASSQGMHPANQGIIHSRTCYPASVQYLSDGCTMPRQGVRHEADSSTQTSST